MNTATIVLFLGLALGASLFAWLAIRGDEKRPAIKR